MSSSLLPVAVYGLEVPPGEVMVPAHAEFPATIRITMAAIDPTEEPEADEDGNIPSVPRATLKIIKARFDSLGDDESDEEDDEYLQKLLNGADDDDSSGSEDEPNGGPSDPSKSKKARQEAGLKKLIEAAEKDQSDAEMEDAESNQNGSKSSKGKEKASDEDDEDSESDSEDDEGLGLEQYVVCTLDTERNYQQPLDITVGEDEKVFFLVSGTHTIHLTGNYVVNEDESDDGEDDEDDYDLTPELEDVIGDEDDELSDELDEIDGAERVKEIDTDEEEEAPQLVNTSNKKGKKRTAEDTAENLDDMISKENKEEAKLNKKQLKKLKNNKGEAVAAAEEGKKEGKGEGKTDKKVQFAKNLEQGPTGSAEKAKQEQKPADKKSPGVKVVQGVTIDDRKIGTGRTVKSGDKVSLRYIGKLQSNGKVFDSNKKGTPFSFKVGKGEVIKGWDIGISGMAVGGERRLTIPPNLAYGSKAIPGIPANSTLIFDVKLLEIK
ncbi:hypothetical protein VTK73DRAFT_3290 [Phialemonium thermophilum]|uniref:peptidylprolyl isomerase n=1 Tax=Phialemonium thermophilum TaxID=223376 RepID=A0ABR3Y8N1_9PEZI